jgi:hypothetical protein
MDQSLHGFIPHSQILDWSRLATQCVAQITNRNQARCCFCIVYNLTRNRAACELIELARSKPRHRDYI